jgi:hypothetical protein
LTTYPTSDGKSDPQDDASPLREKKDEDAGQESGKTYNSQREPLPIEFREFAASIRELFREIKKFIIFIRHRHNANPALIFLTFMLAIAAFTQAVISGIQLGPLRKSASAANTAAIAAKNAAETSQKQFEMSERPWIKVDLVAVRQFDFDVNGNLTLTLEFVMKNVGHSVATGIGLHFEPQPETAGSGGFITSKAGQKDICDIWRQFPFRSDESDKETLFQDQMYVDVTTITISKEAIDKVQFNRDKHIALVRVFGCVDYGFSFAPQHHQTGFNYEIFRPGPLGYGALSIRAGDNVPLSALAIRRSIFGGFYVD